MPPETLKLPRTLARELYQLNQCSLTDIYLYQQYKLKAKSSKLCHKYVKYMQNIEVKRLTSRQNFEINYVYWRHKYFFQKPNYKESL